jgi:predicted RNA binding protein YcfA (HicA-like mRNA interferase family)
MNQLPNYFIKILKENGFIFKCAKGSHQIFYNPLTNKTILVPLHGNEDI